MQMSDDAAFAVLVAASQRDNVTAYTVASRLTASQEQRFTTDSLRHERRSRSPGCAPRL